MQKHLIYYLYGRVFVLSDGQHILPDTYAYGMIAGSNFCVGPSKLASIVMKQIPTIIT